MRVPKPDARRGPYGHRLDLPRLARRYPDLSIEETGFERGYVEIMKSVQVVLAKLHAKVVCARPSLGQRGLRRVWVRVR